jgi:hypothetical protein
MLVSECHKFKYLSHRNGTLLSIFFFWHDFCYTLIEINLLGDGLTTHVAYLQSGRALLACSMATEKHHITPSFHAYGATVGLLNLSYFRLQVPEALCAGLT